MHLYTPMNKSLKYINNNIDITNVELLTNINNILNFDFDFPPNRLALYSTRVFRWVANLELGDKSTKMLMIYVTIPTCYKWVISIKKHPFSWSSNQVFILKLISSVSINENYELSIITQNILQLQMRCWLPHKKIKVENVRGHFWHNDDI